jgi:hypothetical protein
MSKAEDEEKCEGSFKFVFVPADASLPLEEREAVFKSFEEKVRVPSCFDCRVGRPEID